MGDRGEAAKPAIEIRDFTGATETRQLSKKQPLSIGRHSTSDIFVDEDGVTGMHCRIGWNRSGYEVVAAGPDGVEVNGTLVRHAMLSDGDLVRLGSLDLYFIDEAGRKAAKPKGPATNEIVLRPVTEDVSNASFKDALGYYPTRQALAPKP